MALLGAALSCSSEPTGVCDPGDRECRSGLAEAVVTISVASPIDSVIAVGRAIQLSAMASDAEGGPLPGVSFTWSSSAPAVAAVGGSGLLTALAAGTARVEAEAGGVTGALTMRAVEADLEGVSRTLTDPFLAALVRGLDPATRATVDGLLEACSADLRTGNVLGVQACLDDALATSGANGTDTALLGVLALYLQHARQRLNLD